MSGQVPFGNDATKSRRHLSRMTRSSFEHSSNASITMIFGIPSDFSGVNTSHSSCCHKEHAVKFSWSFNASTMRGRSEGMLLEISLASVLGTSTPVTRVGFEKKNGDNNEPFSSHSLAIVDAIVDFPVPARSTMANIGFNVASLAQCLICSRISIRVPSAQMSCWWPRALAYESLLRASKARHSAAKRMITRRLTLLFYAFVYLCYIFLHGGHFVAHQQRLTSDETRNRMLGQISDIQ